MKKLNYFLNAFFGILIGCSCTYAVSKALIKLSIADPYAIFGKWMIGVYAVVSVVMALILIAFSDKTVAGIKGVAAYLENIFKNVSTINLLFGVIGMILGLLIATLLTFLYNGIPWAWLRLSLSAVTYLVLGYLGVVIPTKRKNDLINGFKGLSKGEKKKEKYQNAKILDTSVVIDGRILDVMKSGFLEGTIIISDLILNELRHIADCSDTKRRIRGRRGLDLLKLMEDEFDKRVVVVNVSGKYKDLEEVDEKLVMLTKDLKGKIVTNDYNLNMMARVQKVPVLNINELAGSLKPNVMSGETMEVEVVKTGKEDGQGVAFLDDGTMIVIENGERFVGEKITVEITSIIQTASGRMVFATAA